MDILTPGFEKDDVRLISRKAQGSKFEDGETTFSEASSYCRRLYQLSGRVRLPGRPATLGELDPATIGESSLQVAKALYSLPSMPNRSARRLPEHDRDIISRKMSFILRGWANTKPDAEESSLWGPLARNRPQRTLIPLSSPRCGLSNVLEGSVVLALGYCPTLVQAYRYILIV